MTIKREIRHFASPEEAAEELKAADAERQERHEGDWRFVLYDEHGVCRDDLLKLEQEFNAQVETWRAILDADASMAYWTAHIEGKYLNLEKLFQARRSEAIFFADNEYQHKMRMLK